MSKKSKNWMKRWQGKREIDWVPLSTLYLFIFSFLFCFSSSLLSLYLFLSHFEFLEHKKAASLLNAKAFIPSARCVYLWLVAHNSEMCCFHFLSFVLFLSISACGWAISFLSLFPLQIHSIEKLIGHAIDSSANVVRFIFSSSLVQKAA